MWDIISSGWRCDVSDATRRKQLFALVATEAWELSAVLNNGTMAWPQSDYRERLTEQQEKERECRECGQRFQTDNPAQLKGCKHRGNVWAPLNEREYGRAQPSLAQWQTAHTTISTPEFTAATKSKWSCCGKAVFDVECGGGRWCVGWSKTRRRCPVSKHEPTPDMEKAKRKEGSRHEQSDGFWCNQCCNCIDQICA